MANVTFRSLNNGIAHIRVEDVDCQAATQCELVGDHLFNHAQDGVALEQIDCPLCKAGLAHKLAFEAMKAAGFEADLCNEVAGEAYHTVRFRIQNPYIRLK